MFFMGTPLIFLAPANFLGLQATTLSGDFGTRQIPVRDGRKYRPIQTPGCPFRDGDVGVATGKCHHRNAMIVGSGAKDRHHFRVTVLAPIVNVCSDWRGLDLFGVGGTSSCISRALL